MNNNTITAEIRAINPAIFEGLHIKVGFNFEAPITIKRIPAPFTIKKAWKAVEPANPYTNTAAIIMRDSRPNYYNHTPRVIPITADGIRDDFHDMSYHKYDREHRYNTVFDYICIKGDFNDLRKLDTCEAFIIVQHDNFIQKPITHETDWTQRQRHMKPGTHEQRRSGYSYYKPYTIIIDKSNYRVDLKREDLKRRAAKLRADREKAAADLATRNTAAERMNAITEHFNAAKRRIIDAISAATPTDTAHIDSINEAIDKYSAGLRWIVFDIDRFNTNAKDNKYASPDKYNVAFNSIISRLDAIMPSAEPVNMIKAAHKTTTKGA